MAYATTRLSGIILPSARRVSSISIGRTRNLSSLSNRSSLLRHRTKPQLQLHRSSLQSFSTSTNNNSNETKPVFDIDVDYSSPLGELISRLKKVSITGAFLSVCVMPALVFLKNGDLPNAQQATMGGIATLGATGSTAALHFVFGAYVLEMKTIDQEGKKLLHATTRSVLGFKVDEHVFDPTQDVEPYEGNRPFANFSVHGQPLYVHPEKIDPALHRLLLGKPPQTETNEAAQEKDSEGLPNKKKKKDDNDDEFF